MGGGAPKGSNALFSPSRTSSHPSHVIHPHSRGLPFSECCVSTASVVRCDIRPPRWTSESQIAFPGLGAHETIPIHHLRPGIFLEGLRRSRLGGGECVCTYMYGGR